MPELPLDKDEKDETESLISIHTDTYGNNEDEILISEYYDSPDSNKPENTQDTSQHMVYAALEGNESTQNERENDEVQKSGILSNQLQEEVVVTQEEQCNYIVESNKVINDIAIPMNQENNEIGTIVKMHLDDIQVQFDFEEKSEIESSISIYTEPYDISEEDLLDIKLNVKQRIYSSEKRFPMVNKASFANNLDINKEEKLSNQNEVENIKSTNDNQHYIFNKVNKELDVEKSKWNNTIALQKEIKNLIEEVTPERKEKKMLINTNFEEIEIELDMDSLMSIQTDTFDNNDEVLKAKPTINEESFSNTENNTNLECQHQDDLNIILEEQNTSQINKEIEKLLEDSNNKNHYDKVVEDLQIAKEQWDSVPTFGFKENILTGPLSLEKSKKTLLVSYNDALEYFKTIDMSENLALIRQDLGLNSKGIRSISDKIVQLLTCSSFSMDADIKKELELIFLVARTPLDHENEELERMVVTIYNTLSGSQLPCPSVGSHWDTIGFQSGNPKTDLRGAGMFGILQMLCLLNTAYDLAMDIFLLSQNSHQTFPYAITSLNMTGIVLQFLRERKFISYVGKTDSLIRFANDIYMGLFLKFYQLWKDENKTIVDFDETKKFLKEYASSHILQLINNFHNYIAMNRSQQS